MGQLEDERKSLLAEKGRIETIARLQTTPQQPTIAQCEIDAAVKVAQVSWLILLNELINFMLNLI